MEYKIITFRKEVSWLKKVVCLMLVLILLIPSIGVSAETVNAALVTTKGINTSGTLYTAVTKVSFNRYTKITSINYSQESAYPEGGSNIKVKIYKASDLTLISSSAETDQSIAQNQSKTFNFASPAYLNPNEEYLIAISGKSLSMRNTSLPNTITLPNGTDMKLSSTNWFVGDIAPPTNKLSETGNMIPFSINALNQSKRRR